MTKKEAKLAKADDEKMPPAAHDDSEEEAEEESEAEGDKVEKSDATVQRIVAILGKLDARMDAFDAKLKSAYPQKLEMMYGDQESGVDHDAEGKTSLDGDKVITPKAPENAVKPTKDTQNTQGAFVGPDDGKMGKMLAEFKAKLLEEVKAATAETLKASTPTPVSYKQKMEQDRTDRIALMKSLVYAAVEDSQKRAVFSTDAENGEGGFLALSLPAQEDHYRFMRKMVEEA